MRATRLAVAALCALAVAVGPGRADELEDQGRLARILPSDGDHFGTALDMEGDVLAVGIPGGNGTTVADSGAVELFRRSAGRWFRTHALSAGNAAALDGFGAALDLRGNRLVVGAPTHVHNGAATGAVYVFLRQGANWVQEAELIAPGAVSLDRFGAAVALGDGFLAVGAPGHDAHGNQAGAVFTFERSSGSWAYQGELLSPTPGSTGEFGATVSVQGALLGAGAPGEAAPGGPTAGRAHLFAGGTGGWTFLQSIDPETPDAGSLFGASLDMGIGLVAVGAPFDRGAGGYEGAATVYTRTAGVWSVFQEVVPAAASPGDEVGRSVSIEETTFVFGASSDDRTAPGAGAAYVYERRQSSWQFCAEIRPPDGVASDRLGEAITHFGEGIAVGAPVRSTTAPEYGAVYAYAWSDGLVPICFGDGTGTPCPCGNESVGLEGAGCKNSLGRGASMFAHGSVSILADDLWLRAFSVPPGLYALLFSGTSVAGNGDGLPFGDGLRCVNGAIYRHRLAVADGAGVADFQPGGLASSLGVGPGDQRAFQAWYRDPFAGPCGNLFNLSNAMLATFAP